MELVLNMNLNTNRKSWVSIHWFGISEQTQLCPRAKYKTRKACFLLDSQTLARVLAPGGEERKKGWMIEWPTKLRGGEGTRVLKRDEMRWSVLSKNRKSPGTRRTPLGGLSIRLSLEGWWLYFLPPVVMALEKREWKDDHVDSVQLRLDSHVRDARHGKLSPGQLCEKGSKTFGRHRCWDVLLSLIKHRWQKYKWGFRACNKIFPHLRKYHQLIPLIGPRRNYSTRSPLRQTECGSSGSWFPCE